VRLVAGEPHSGLRIRHIPVAEMGQEGLDPLALLPGKGQLTVEETGELRLHDLAPDHECGCGVSKAIQQRLGAQLAEQSGFLSGPEVEQRVIDVKKHALNLHEHIPFRP
jgi:hypothetical protein